MYQNCHSTSCSSRSYLLVVGKDGFQDTRGTAAAEERTPFGTATGSLLRAESEMLLLPPHSRNGGGRGWGGREGGIAAMAPRHRDFYF